MDEHITKTMIDSNIPFYISKEQFMDIIIKLSQAINMVASIAQDAVETESSYVKTKINKTYELLAEVRKDLHEL